MASNDLVNNLRFSPANYRVRLFLSVDLSGSTAFKNSQAGETRADGASPRWVSIFEHFYTDFPARYRTKYVNRKLPTVGNDSCPVVWKAVGDELVFCGRVSNKKAVSVALSAFIEAMHDYRKKLSDDCVDLNLKGAAWLAAFPEPNRAVQVRRMTGNADLISASEALEHAADISPFDYDFLGKAIDTGFRVASTATPERFAISVQLARLIAGEAPGFGFDFEIRFAEPIFLKGVNKGEPYPRLYIDTMTHLPVEGIRKQERKLLNKSAPPSRDDLKAYLDAYCGVVGTDEVMLPTDINDQVTVEPENYTNNRVRIEEHLRQEEAREPRNEETLDLRADESTEELTADGLLNPLADNES